MKALAEISLEEIWHCKLQIVGQQVVLLEPFAEMMVHANLIQVKLIAMIQVVQMELFVVMMVIVM